MENNNKSSNRFLESLRDVRGMWFVVLALAGIAAFLFVHWALLMLVSAIEAIIASAAMHFDTVFTLTEVLFISGVVIVATCILAIVRNNYYSQNRRKRPQQQNRRPQQQRTNSVVDMKELRRKPQQPLQRFDVK
ncbi:MAG: hypothetical protein IJX99_06360 [Clostridia bacterium]|nr:hypothetical protein [Clostridia bacterium]